MTRRDRLRRLSRAMALACLLLAPLLLIGEALLWLVREPCGDWLPATSAGLFPDPVAADLCLGGPDGLTAWQRGLGLAIALLPAGAAAVGLLLLYRLFRLYARGAVFERANTRVLRRFAAAVLCYALARPLAYSLTVLLLTYGNPPGQRHLAIRLGDGELAALFFGGLFLVIAWVMDEAREIAEDHRQIV